MGEGATGSQQKAGKAVSANVSQVTTPFANSVNEHLLNRACYLQNYVLPENSHSIRGMQCRSNKYTT